MSSNATSGSRRGRFAAVLACAAAVAAAAAIGLRPDTTDIAPGTAVIEVHTGEVQSLSWRSRDLRLEAHRVAPGGTFLVDAGPAGNHAAQQCVSSPDLAGILPRLSTVTARRQLSLHQLDTEFPVELGTLKLTDRIDAEPMPPFSVRTRSNRSGIALVYDKVAIETNIAPDLFTKLQTGCNGLAVK